MPVSFECAFAGRVVDHDRVEQAFHFGFGSYRINSKQEFFQIGSEQAVARPELMVVDDVTPEPRREADEVNADSREGARRLNEYRANACLAQAFGNGTGAYAVFRTRRGDSTGATAPVTRDGRVTLHSFEGDLAGSGSDGGRITERECRNPHLSGRTDTRVFACA